MTLLLPMVLWSLLAACGAEGDDADQDGDETLDDDSGNPEPDDDSAVDDDESPGEEPDLLEKFQPLLIQKLAPDYEDVAYPPESDRIGRLSLHPGDEHFDYTVRVNTAAPVMYHFTASAVIRGQTLPQLVFAFFYPERPLLATFADDPIWYLFHWFDAGAIDGKVVRITLDADGETPLLIEAARNCGCGWQLHVNQLVDDEARAEFEALGQEYPGLVKPDAPHDTRYVWIMPADEADVPLRPVVVDDYGWTESPHHVLATFTSLEQWSNSDLEIAPGVLYRPADIDVDVSDAGALDVQSFARLPYDPLYTLSPTGSADEVGIFDEYGYVWNAYSLFYRILRDLTDRTEFPGTPRDPADLEVVHETMDFWEQQALYETFIYLPESLFGPPEF
jgi:hypothetical protein